MFEEALDLIVYLPEKYRGWLILLFVAARYVQVLKHSRNGDSLPFLGPLGPRLLTWLIGKDFLDDEVLEKIAKIVLERLADDTEGLHKEVVTSVPTED